MDPRALQALARHAEAVATARSFAVRAGAERVVLLLDRGDADAVMVDCAKGGAVELTVGDDSYNVPASAAVPAPARPLPDVRTAPASAMAVDLDRGELSAPVGAIGHLGDSVLALARAFGGRTVATAEFATREPDRPITLAAREGEPLVLAVGDREFLLPDGA
jgi:hypothetical protein